MALTLIDVIVNELIRIIGLLNLDEKMLKEFLRLNVTYIFWVGLQKYSNCCIPSKVGDYFSVPRLYIWIRSEDLY